MSVAVLVLVGLVMPALPSVLGATLTDNVPFLDSVDTVSPRDDHTFNAIANTWAAVGTLVHAQPGNTGDLETQLRQTSPGGAIIAFDPAGNEDTNKPLSVLAVNMYGVGNASTFVVSEQHQSGAPGYAVEVETSPTGIFTTPYSDTSSFGANGVIQSYQIYLNRRDTVDVRVAVPPSFTYNYHLQLFLFGPESTNFYSASGGLSNAPAAASGGPENADQFIRYTAPLQGWYLLVVGNAWELQDVPYTLTVYTNGRALGDEAPESGTVSNWNVNDDYAFANPSADWGFVAVRADSTGYGSYLTAELHAPTFDSNVLASETLTTGSATSGVIAVNRHTAGTSNLSLVTLQWGPYAMVPVAYTLEMDNRVPTIASGSAARRFDFNVSEILQGGQVALLAGETIELHAEVDPLFTYPYELGIAVFAPGASYYSAGGTGQMGAIAHAQGGTNKAQDLTFTAPVNGWYGIALLSLNSTYPVPVDLTTTIQGRPLAHNEVFADALEGGNPQDLFAMTVDADRWGVFAGRMVAGTGSFVLSITSGGFDATPVASDQLGSSAALPTFAVEAVNGYGKAQTDYFGSVTRTMGAPEYLVEFDAAPLPLPRNTRTAVSVPGGQVVSAYEVSLNAGETADFRLRVADGYSYPYSLQLLLFSPASPYYSTGGSTAPAPFAVSGGGIGEEQDLVITAPSTGSWLVVLANLGDLREVPASLDLRINGEPLSVGVSAVADLTAGNAVNYYAFTANPGVWTVAGVKIGSTTSAGDTLVHSLHGPTPDSNALATDQVRGVGGEGIIAIDGFSLVNNSSYFLSESAALGGSREITFQVQIGNVFQGLTTTSQVVTASLVASTQFLGYQMNLNAGQTLDLRLRRAEGYSYPYSLGLFVFAPGSGNASSSGEGGGAPVVWSANGPSVEQDGIFTAMTTGIHLILVVNLDTPRDIAYSLNLSVDGWMLLSDSHLAGDLNAYNRADQYSFQTAGGGWTAAGIKWTGGPSTVRGGLHTLGLNTLPLATLDANGQSTVAVLPFFAPVNSSNASTTFYLNATLASQPGASEVEYVVAFEATPSLWSSNDLGTRRGFNLSGSTFFALHELSLARGDKVDLELDLQADLYTKESNLNLAVYEIPLAPQILQVEPVGVARGPTSSETLAFQANETSRYLLVVENAGAMDTVPYQLTMTRHTVMGSPPRPVNITSNFHDIDTIDVNWTPSGDDDFQQYEIYITLTEELSGPARYTIHEREDNYERIEGSFIQPGHVYYIWILVRDSEGRASTVNHIAVKTDARDIFQEPTFWMTIAVVGALALAALFALMRARGVREGRGFRLRSSKAEAVVDEKKGPKGKARAPKGAEPAAVPAAPSKSSQDSVDYMQRVMKGGR